MEFNCPNCGILIDTLHHTNPELKKRRDDNLRKLGFNTTSAIFNPVAALGAFASCAQYLFQDQYICPRCKKRVDGKNALIGLLNNKK